MDKIYACIDLKSFYASVECAERNLDPFKSNLVVADPSRGKGAICLSVSPGLRSYGVKNRCRIFDIPQNIEFITALPRMKKYIEYSASIYEVYLKYISKDDIHIYSIDEVFMDLTTYLPLYDVEPIELVKRIIADVERTTKIPATAGIGTNMYLAKIALDITAKHVESHIAFLDEKTFIETLSHHKPITDFWQIGSGIAKRLSKLGIYDMYDIAQADEKTLFSAFGVNARFLIDHAKGIETCTIEDIKNYKTKSKSISSGQILFENYNYDKALLALKEMVELLCLDLIDKNIVAGGVALYIGYSDDSVKSVATSVKMSIITNTYRSIIPYFSDLFLKNVDKNLLIRRINIGFFDIHDESYELLDLFTSKEETEKERVLDRKINEIKKKYGKSAILKGMNLEEGATTLKRNKLVGGHNEE